MGSYHLGELQAYHLYFTRENLKNYQHILILTYKKMIAAAYLVLSITILISKTQGAQLPECTSNGFFRHPDDCTRFYRCVDLTGRGYFQTYTFSCPVGTVFDENVSVCNHPWAAPPCDEPEAETTTKMEEIFEETDEDSEDLTVIVAPTFDFECSNKGIFSHESDCARFWLCKAQNGEPELYKCPAGYLFNDEKHRCVPEGEVSCAKTPDLLRISSEPAPIQLRVSQLESFFAQWSRF